MLWYDWNQTNWWNGLFLVQPVESASSVQFSKYWGIMYACVSYLFLPLCIEWDTSKTKWKILLIKATSIIILQLLRLQSQTLSNERHLFINMFGLAARSAKSKWHHDFLKIPSVTFPKIMAVSCDSINLTPNQTCSDVLHTLRYSFTSLSMYHFILEIVVGTLCE